MLVASSEKKRQLQRLNLKTVGMRIIGILVGCLLLVLVCGGPVYSSGEADGNEAYGTPIQRGSYHCIPVICERDNYPILCLATDPAKPGRDKCLPCSNNTINQNRIETRIIKNHIQLNDVCRKPECYCSPEAKLENPDECLKTGIPVCVCNLDKGYYGHDPKICEKWSGNVTKLQIGFGLTQDGHVEECKQGYVKDKVGYGSCRPHRKCQDDEKIISNGNSTTDTQCGPLTQSTVSPDVNSTDGTPRSKGGMKDQVKIGVIVGVIVFVVIMIVSVVIIWLFRNRRGRNTGRNDDNPENGQQNGGQRMEHLEQNVGQTTKPLILNGE